MEPFQSRRPRPQIERERQAAEDHLGLGEHPVALGARARTGGARARDSATRIGRPGVADLAIEPAAGVGEADRWIDGLDPGAIGGIEALDGKDVDGAHG